MIRKALLTVAASLMTLSAFSGTVTIMTAGEGGSETQVA
jgi:hypothetical protein